MPVSAKRLSTRRKAASRDKVRAHRARLRAQGLRPIQIWVPDMGSPAFKAEARRRSRLVAASPHEAEDQAVHRSHHPGGHGAA
ncbi:MAG: DUF3018 family protein [Acidimicrobiia bacterium]|nr:DUF3018 family protein [Acidimicrobiia bacterium]